MGGRPETRESDQSERNMRQEMEDRYLRTTSVIEGARDGVMGARNSDTGVLYNEPRLDSNALRAKPIPRNFRVIPSAPPQNLAI